MKIKNRNNKIKKFIIIVGVLVLLPEVALALDLDKGAKEFFDPLTKAIEDHWGKGVMIGGLTGVILGEGDARQRAVRAGIGSALAGGMALAIFAAFA